MKNTKGIINIIIKEIETAEKKWNYAYEIDETGMTKKQIERIRDQAMDEMITLKTLYRKITGKGFNQK